MKEYLDKIKTHFEQLNNRERLMVIAAMIALVVFIPYQLIWSPIINGVEKNRIKVENQERDLFWMQSKLSEVQQLARAKPGSSSSGKSLYGIIEKTAQQKFGSEIRIQQEGKKGIRIQIKQVRFNDVMYWLDDLQVRHKVNIKDFKIDNSKIPGTVRASILVQS